MIESWMLGADAEIDYRVHRIAAQRRDLTRLQTEPRRGRRLRVTRAPRRNAA